ERCIGACLALARARSEAMAASELRFRAVQQTSPDAFLIYTAVRDAHGAVCGFECQFAHPAALRVLGKSAAGRLNGRSEDGPGQLFQVLVDVLEKDHPWQGEHPYRHGSSTRWLRTMAARAGDRVALCSSDVTMHHAAEMAVRQNEARQSFL